MGGRAWKEGGWVTVHHVFQEWKSEVIKVQRWKTRLEHKKNYLLFFICFASFLCLQFQKVWNRKKIDLICLWWLCKFPSGDMLPFLLTSRQVLITGLTFDYFLNEVLKSDLKTKNLTDSFLLHLIVKKPNLKIWNFGYEKQESKNSVFAT